MIANKTSPIITYPTWPSWLPRLTWGLVPAVLPCGNVVSLGLPTITVVLAENQFRTTEDVARAGATEFLGWSDSLETEDYSHAILNPNS